VRRAARIGLALVGAVIWSGLAVAYLVRPDAAALVTLFPAWGWGLAGLLALLPVRRLYHRSAVWAAAAAWLLFIPLFAEEPASLIRGLAQARYLLPVPAKPPGLVRVVSLNCAGGDPAAAQEVIAYHPDIVLLQESPRAADVEAVARALFGASGTAIVGWDTAIVARAPLALTQPARASSYWVEARARLPDGREAELVSLRYVPPVLSLAFWSPESWREQAENRQARRRQAEQLRARMAALPDIPLIVGGDFNAPADDAVCRLLKPRLRDTFREAGCGWGSTGTNDYPLVRVDQVWASRPFRAVGVVARKTAHSDHRLVVCDLR
jgi:vancomycin resistance protein VanJ